MSTRLVLLALADQENGRVGVSGLRRNARSAARHHRRTLMFVSDTDFQRPHARYLAWILVIGMASMLLPSGEVRAQGMKKDMPAMGGKDMPAKKGEATKAATATGTVTAGNTGNRRVILDSGPTADTSC